MTIKTVGVVGAGTMGNGIAQVFAQSGFSVRLVDVAQPMLDRARGSIEKSLSKLVDKGRLTAADRDATLGRLETTTSLDQLSDVDYVVEAIVESAAADYPGFIANRILMPMINEAIYAVMEGVGTPEAIDTVMKLGMNHPMGPLALADFIGLDVCLAILTVLHDGLGDPKYRACPLLRRMVAAGQLGRKSGQGFYAY